MIYNVYLDEIPDDDVTIIDHTKRILRAQPYTVSNDLLSLSKLEDIDKHSGDHRYNIMLGFHVHDIYDNDPYILERFLDRIKLLKKYDKVQIVFSQGWDLYYVSDKRVENYKIALKNFDQHKISFAVCNYHAVKKLRRAFPLSTCKYWSWYPARIKKNCLSRSHPRYFNEDPRFKNKHRSAKTLCLNNYNKIHRRDVVEFLHKHEPEDYYCTLRDKNLLLRKERILSQMDPRSFLSIQDIPPLSNMLDSYTYICTETHVDGNKKDILSKSFNRDDFMRGWWSEKTYKAMYYELPFIIVGLPYTLKYLKSCGYETFPEFFDESYDVQIEYKNKKSDILNNISKILNQDRRELHELFWSKEVQEKLKHNKETFIQEYKNTEF